MNCLSIGIEEDIDYIKDIIENETGKYINKTEFKIDHRNNMNIDYLDITVREKKDMNNIKIKIANILSRYIINKYEKKFLEKIISTNYCYFNQGERKETLNTALKNIKAEDEKDVLNNLFFLKRKNIIVRSLIEYFDNSNELILNGFVTFRLKEYFKELEELPIKRLMIFN